ncbi:MAG TPA: gamma-glutamylcyclotransferase family protein [Methylomirabilota bacterium]|jgi:gamma-glutamylcyclotransferase (GGCT)/AIG2-like uncharacterized protein YtfP|nr:gamma-glutamylcyclotransferase family protein [Methylomirabilota bacterium]
MAAVTSAGAASNPGPDRLFAYGTLMTGFSRRPFLGAALLEGLGRIRGSLYNFGEYPGLVLDDGGWVSGELYHVPDLPARLPALDREEWYDAADETGSLYVRRLVAVHGTGSAVREAWVYAYNEHFGAAAGRGPRIESGDWRAHLASARGTP